MNARNNTSVFKKSCKTLENLGFEQIRQKGSHLFLEHPDGRITIVPIHSNKEIKKSLILKIIKDTHISRDEWNEIIKNLIIF